MKEFFQSVKQKWDNVYSDKTQEDVTKIKIERDKTYETRWVWYHTLIVVELAVTNILLLWILWILWDFGWIMEGPF